MTTQLTRAMRACGAVALRQMRRRRRSVAFFATLPYPTDDGHPVIDMAPLLSDNDSGDGHQHHADASPGADAGDRAAVVAQIGAALRTVKYATNRIAAGTGTGTDDAPAACWPWVASSCDSAASSSSSRSGIAAAAAHDGHTVV